MCVIFHELFYHPIADADYETTMFSLTFSPSDESSGIMCRKISILDDSIAGEPNEAFSVTLISASPNGAFEEDTTCITITDDDSKLTLVF